MKSLWCALFALVFLTVRVHAQSATSFQPGQVLSAAMLNGAFATKMDTPTAAIPGINCDGIHDDTTAIQTAVSLGGLIRIPAATCNIGGPITVSRNNTHVVFGGLGATTINSTAATGDVFLITGTHVTLDGGVSFTHGAARTSGADIHCSSAYCTVGQIYDDSPFWGVELDGNAALAVIDRPWCRNIVPDATAPGSACVRIGVSGYNESSIVNSPFCDIDAAASSTTIPTACIIDDWSDALQIINPNLIHGKTDVLLTASTGQSVVNTQIVGHGFLDTPYNYSLALVTTGTGNIINTTIQTAMSDAGVLGQAASAGLYVSQSGTGTIEGITCTGCKFFKDGSSSVSLHGYVEDLAFTGGCAAQSTDAFTLAGVVTGLKVTGGFRVGTCDAFTAVTNGFDVTTASSLVDVSDVDFTGTTHPFVGLSYLSASRVHDNIGYNPVGGSIPTVGASPWTYVNGPSPAMLCANGGTVSAVATQGIAPLYVSGGCYSLGPNASIMFTFSVAPSVQVVTQ